MLLPLLLNNVLAPSGAGSKTQSLAITLDGVAVSVAQNARHNQSIAATLDGVTVSVNQVSGHTQSIAPTLDGVAVSVSQNARHSQSLTITLDGVTASIAQSGAAGTTNYSGEVILQPRKVYIKRGKNYLLFNSNSEADSYLEAEDAIETAKKSSRGAARRKIKALNVVKPEVVAAPKLEAIGDLLKRFEVNVDFPELQLNNDIQAIFDLQSVLYAMQDEEDIELLLLAA